jgi:transposase
MHDFGLTRRQRRQLETQRRTVRDAHVLRRILALLDLDRGKPIAEVASTLGVSRQTVYNWSARFEQEATVAALQDRGGRGRRSLLSEQDRRFLEWSMTQPPDALGYASVDWTAPLLLDHLATWMGIRVADDTLRRELHRLGYVWKRPRYVLEPDPERAKKSAGSADKSTTFHPEP